MILLWILISTFLVSIIAFIGVLSLAIRGKALENLLLVLVALSAGALMGGAFLHLIPEAVELSEEVAPEVAPEAAEEELFSEQGEPEVEAEAPARFISRTEGNFSSKIDEVLSKYLGR